LPLYDFECESCAVMFEAVVPTDTQETDCHECKKPGAKRRPSRFSLFTVTVPCYPGSKKRKAGYLHSHGNRPKTPGKIQVGYGS